MHGVNRSADEIVSSYIAPLMSWTATGDSIPYGNFNDWLHYSGFTSHV